MGFNLYVSRGIDARRSFARVSPVPDAALPSLQGIKVLVVEDDEATRYIFSRQLSQTGAIVTVVEDAESALLVLHAESTDVLVVDLKLPGLNGLQLLAQTPTRPRATIAITAFDDATTRDRALRSGFKAYLPKPVEPERLVQEIARQLGSQG
jgi:CheY-like chemotaxis protein